MAVEDDHFFKHWGISPKGIARSIIRNMRAGRVVQGASTIATALSRCLETGKLAHKLRNVIGDPDRAATSKRDSTILPQSGLFRRALTAPRPRSYFLQRSRRVTLADCALLSGLIGRRAATIKFLHADARPNAAPSFSRMLDEGLITAQNAMRPR